MLLCDKQGACAWLRLNRPEVLNALNSDLVRQLADTLYELDQDPAIRVIVITGEGKAFAAGADIGEMARLEPQDFVVRQFFADWDRLRKVSKPIIAAVNGYALGGGCELAMCCDMIVASENAKFGQPEINLGVIPGAGGTQRLTRAVGKHKAMELILTGRMLSAQEAMQLGLINKVVSADALHSEVAALAEEIAQKPTVAVRMAKQAINRALDMSLEDGLNFEQNAFYLLFSTPDQAEGMQAFSEKRKPKFQLV